MENLTLLVVDDDPLSRRLLLKVLEGCGVKNIVVAENGSEGVEALANTKTKIDAVLSDIDMPVLDGWGFVSKIRLGAVPDYTNVPIYMMTAKGSEKNEQKARYKKVNGYALKPPRKDVILKILDEILGA